MAKASASPAKRTNRAVLGIAALLLMGAGSSAYWGSGSSESLSGSTSSVPPLTDPVSGSGTRPAETKFSWFDHGMTVEQTDYPMKELSCKLLGDVITPDLCAVAKTSHGSFMFVGTEGYWDEFDTYEYGFANIPLDMTVFTMRNDHQTPRATSVMNGLTEKAYTKNQVQMDLYKTTINGDEVLVVVKRQGDSGTDAYAYFNSVNVIAASNTGAPTVVATYAGPAMTVGSDGTKIVLSSLRYKATSEKNEVEWYSRVTLSPSEGDSAQWMEHITSGSTAVNKGQGMTLVDSYVYPFKKGGKDDPSASDV
jgi:hypothetical protein